MHVVLIEPEEGYVGSVAVGSSREELIEAISYDFARQLDRPQWAPGDREWSIDELHAVTHALKEHQDWSPGIRLIPPIEPYYMPWTLIVAPRPVYLAGLWG